MYKQVAYLLISVHFYMKIVKKYLHAVLHAVLALIGFYVDLICLVSIFIHSSFFSKKNTS